MTPARYRCTLLGLALGLGLTGGFGCFGGDGGRASAEVLRLTTQDWPPYQTVRGGQVDGLAAKTIRCILDKLDQPVEITVLSWMRAQKMVEMGEADGFFSASRSDHRDTFAELSAPVAPQVWRWYFLRDDRHDFRNKATQVGVQIGSAMERWLDENGYTRIERSASIPNLVRLLNAGRVEVLLANELVFEQALSRLKVTDRQFKSVEHSNRPLGVYLSRVWLARNQGFLERFNAEAPGCRGTTP